MTRYFLFVCFGLVISANSLPAQHQRVVDSLQNVLLNQSGGERFQALYALAFEYIHENNLKALECIEEAERAALLSRDSLSIVKSIRVRGQILHLLGRPQQAISILEPIATQRTFIQFPKEYFSAMTAIASSYLFMYELDKALELHFKIYRSVKETSHKEFLSVSLSNIGFVYYKLKDYRKALHYIKEGLKNENHFDTITSHLNISLCYSHLGELEHAKTYLDAVVQACKGDCPARRIMHIKYASGFLHYRAGKFGLAQFDCKESLAIARRKKDVRIQLDNLYLLAKMSVSNGRISDARDYLDQAEQILQTNIPFNLEKVKILEQLSQLYLAMRDFKSAALYQSEYIQLKDSLHNENVTARLMDVESQHLESTNQAKIAEQQQIINLNDEVMKRQRLLNVLYATVAVLTMVIIVFLFRTYCKKRMLNAFLRKKVRERTRELEANRRELEIKASQQQLLLRHVFSGISGKLATVKGLCLTAREEIVDPVARGYVDRIDEASANVDQFLRSVLKNAE